MQAKTLINKFIDKDHFYGVRKDNNLKDRLKIIKHGTNYYLLSNNRVLNGGHGYLSTDYKYGWFFDDYSINKVLNEYSDFISVEPKLIRI